jgi:hypothetical protein
MRLASEGCGDSAIVEMQERVLMRLALEAGRAGYPELYKVAKPMT